MVCVCRRGTYPPLQAVPLLQRQRVGLGNDWDDVDFAVDRFHELHIQRLQTGKVRKKRNNCEIVEKGKKTKEE